MHLSRKQAAVITFLNVVIIMLAIFIILSKKTTVFGANAPILPDDGDNNQTVDTPPEPTHEKLRKAIAGKVAEIKWETRLMGSGDESIVYAGQFSGVTYVFGNATVADYDFDTYGGFVCRLSDSLDILGFTYFEGRTTAVCPIGGGFAVGTIVTSDDADSKARMYAVDYSGEAKRVAIPNGEVVDVMIDGNMTAVVTRPNDNSFMLTEYSADGDVWNAEYSTRISSGYTLDYFDCYKLGNEYIIAARAYSLPRYDSLVFYTFEAGGDPSAHFYGGTNDSLMQPYAVLPYPSGYAAVCRRDGVAVIVTVDYAFKTYRRESLGFAFERATMIYESNKYYVCLDCVDGPVTYELDINLSRRTIGVADGMKMQAAVGGTAVTLIGEVSDKLRIASLGGAETIDIDMTVEQCRAIGTQNGDLMIVVSSCGGDAVSAATGGRDIYVLLIRK